MTKHEGIIDTRGVCFVPLREPFGVVSLVPSWTETLFDLGLTGREILGRTNYCIHPRSTVGKIERVGGPRDPDLERVFALDPDLIIADREENRKEDVDQIDKHWVPSRVFVTGPTTIDQVLSDVERLGCLFNTPRQARQLIENVRAWMTRLDRQDRGTVVYLVWQDPFIAASRETYIGDVLETLGYRNVCERSTLAGLSQAGSVSYPAVSLEQLISLRPDTILLSTEPFPFRRGDADRLRSRIHKLDRAYAERVHVRIVNGEYFCWYGSRMTLAFRYFVEHQTRV